VNWSGGERKNVEIDLFQENRNKDMKAMIKTELVVLVQINHRIFPLNQSLRDVSIYYLLSKAVESRVTLM
jgi:hypothetical protein